MNCIICDNSQLKIIKKCLRDHKSIKVAMCLECQHQQLKPLPLSDKLHEFYDKNMQAKLVYTDIDIKKVQEKAIFDVAQRVKLIKKLSQIKKKLKY